ncbi:asparaginase [Actinocrispum wychmicini]|uniref:L-asparaginase n=1 Tax=Actinocrispum wychmicini TaxID=1213861 RepID=A0A4R2JX44_9PSEU|nr:asparaginase [Actinocrispum wychmicini]TCO65111.1 L-asparaginase [Actinocrispum wychmicini]
MTKPVVCVLSLGGTITMTAAAGGGVTPALGADALLDGLVSAVPEIEVDGRTLSRVAGAALTPADVLAAWVAAEARVRQGAHGVVLVQGTDTLDESAYLLDLVWGLDAPIVLTGAMRAAGVPGADGPANLIAAMRTAADPAARDRGALVVINDEIHAARRVHKGHAEAMQAFGSNEFGLLGRLVEGRPVFANQFGRHDPIDVRPMTGPSPWVPLLPTFLGDDGTGLRAMVDAGAGGVVVAAHGVGHVSPNLAEVIGALAGDVPIVIVTRTGAGTTLRRTYNFPGSESDLINRGAIPAGWLTPNQARLLLWLLLATGADRDQIVRALHRHGD